MTEIWFAFAHGRCRGFAEKGNQRRGSRASLPDAHGGHGTRIAAMLRVDAEGALARARELDAAGPDRPRRSGACP